MGHHPVLGRAVVVHDSAGARVGCGLIEPSFGEVVTIGTYPGAASNISTGILVVSTTNAGELTFNGTLAGLSGTGGWHVHEGASCEAASGVGGHYVTPEMTTDPWDAVKYTADASGTADCGGAASLL